jgi:predicted transcriptional regulator
MQKQTAPALRAYEKWPVSAKLGFQVVPDILFRKQAELKLDTKDLVVLLNLTMHWWYQSQLPFPRTNQIASRMGLNIRTVQRSRHNLETLGYIKRVKEKLEDGSERVVYDLSGIVNKLESLAKNDRKYHAVEVRDVTPF